MWVNYIGSGTRILEEKMLKMECWEDVSIKDCDEEGKSHKNTGGHKNTYFRKEKSIKIIIINTYW